MNSTLQCNCPASRRDMLKLLAAVGVGADAAFAQDPVKTDPRSYRVVFENAKVRVLEYIARPGLGVCGTGMHSHPDHVAIPLTSGKVKVTGEDGKTFIAEVKAGEAFWDPAVTHMAEDISGSGSRALIVEIKDRDWKPSTG